MHRIRVPLMRGRQIAPAALIVLSLVLGRPALASPAAAAQEGLPRFEPAPCPVEVPDYAEVEVDCGYLVVAEDRSDPGSRTIRLAVAILRSFSEDPAPDPVVYLEGGPGGSALEGLDTWLESPFLDRRDLILLEQRGTQYAEPALDCPEVKEANVEAWVQGLGDEEEVALAVEAAGRCRDRLQGEGVDLAAYNSAASAADLEDLRQALGYDEWNLYGISYGTRLALTAMRDQPRGIRSVILDSVYPPPVDGLVALAPNTGRVVDKLLADCAADVDCRAAYPDLEADLYALIEGAQAEPIVVTVRHPESGEWLDLPLDGDYIVAELFLAFYDSSLIPLLPLVIDQALAGNHDVLVPLTDFYLASILSGSEGMNYSVECYEEVPFNPPEEIAAAAETVPPLLRAFGVTATLEICDLWGAGQAGPVEDEPVSSDIPTLVLAGDYDPITPPSSGRLAAGTLSESYYFEFPGLGHGVTVAESDCPVRIAADFLDDPGQAPGAACLDEMGPPSFVTTGDLHLTPLPYQLVVELNAGDSGLLLTLLAFVDLLYLLLVFVCLYALLRLLRVWPGAISRGDGWYHLLLGLLALLNLFLIAALAAVLLESLFSLSSTLIVGLPRGLSSILLALSLLSALLTLVLALLTTLAWFRGHWSVARRLLYSGIAIALLAFLGFLGSWNLLGLPFT